MVQASERTRSPACETRLLLSDSSPEATLLMIRAIEARKAGRSVQHNMIESTVDVGVRPCPRASRPAWCA